ncbi:hypothetical protein P8452_21065 [Trifolium repens]|nr:hypothetical protein P8452_21065 [Trifolium repens]
MRTKEKKHRNNARISPLSPLSLSISLCSVRSDRPLLVSPAGESPPHQCTTALTLSPSRRTTALHLSQSRCRFDSRK